MDHWVAWVFFFRCTDLFGECLSGDWVAHVLWALFDSDAFGAVGLPTVAERHLLSASRFKVQLLRWYAKQRLEGRSDFSELEDFRLEKIGTKDKPIWCGKAAECKTIIPFVLSVLRAHHRALFRPVADALVAAGECLVSFAAVAATSPIQPSVTECQVPL